MKLLVEKIKLIHHCCYGFDDDVSVNEGMDVRDVLLVDPDTIEEIMEELNIGREL